MHGQLHKQDHPMGKHLGIFRKKISLFEAVALIVTSTIGAGVLGIPYAIAHIGLPLGILFIIAVGMVMIGMHLLVGEIVVRTKQRLHLPGLAYKYLGMPGRILMAVLMYSLLFGILVIYIIGEGETLAALFGGSPTLWSVIFFLIGSLFIIFGIRTIKTAEFVLGIGILFVVVTIAAISTPHIDTAHLSYTSWKDLLLPYGVLLFAYHGVASLPEAHALLQDKNHTFFQAIVVAGMIVMSVYLIFTMAVIGVTGPATTEIATIGLGAQVGPIMHIFGNIFAALAMGTSFLMSGIVLRDSLKWDFRMHHGLATALTCCVPFLIFAFGVRGFIAAIDIVGGVFVSLELFLLLLIYWQATRKGDLKPVKYGLHHAALIGSIIFISLMIGTWQSVSRFLI